MSTSRLESFSDGVLAVAITLLVLDIVVPPPHAGHVLSRDLGREWPRYAAYAISFITVGIIWINHHVAVGRLREVDHAVLFLNLILLMSIVLLPFATALMAQYLEASHGEHLAAAIYGGSLVFMGVSFGALNGYILLGRPQLMTTRVSAPARRKLFIRSFSGVSPYVVATALAPVSPYVTLAITGAVAAFYALPLASSLG